MISPLAHIDPEAKIGENCEIGAFAYIDKNVVIGDNCVIMPHASVLYGTRMGNNNKIDSRERYYQQRNSITRKDCCGKR